MKFILIPWNKKYGAEANRLFPMPILKFHEGLKDQTRKEGKLNSSNVLKKDLYSLIYSLQDRVTPASADDLPDHRHPAELIL